MSRNWVNVLFIILALMIVVYVEVDAANRHRQPIICPPGYSAPADCTNQPGGETP